MEGNYSDIRLSLAIMSRLLVLKRGMPWKNEVFSRDLEVLVSAIPSNRNETKDSGWC